MTRRICVVTGSRAEYGLLRSVLQRLRSAPEIELSIIATGMHLSAEFGMTVEEIAHDGFSVHRVQMLLSGDTAVSIAKSMGVGMIGFADTFAAIGPDLLLLLGDRFEHRIEPELDALGHRPRA